MALEPHCPTPPRPHPADVGRAVAAALTTGGSTAELERTVRAYVRALRSADVPPEQALKRVKGVVGVARVASHTAPTLADQLAEQVLVWFVAEYYRAD